MDIVSADHFSYTGHHSSLIFSIEAEIPSDRARFIANLTFLRLSETGYIFGPQLPLSDIACNLNEVRNHNGSRSIAASSAAIEHLGSDLASGDENGVINVLHSGQHGMAAYHPWAYRYLDARISLLRRTNQPDGAVKPVHGANIGCANLADAT